MGGPTSHLRIGSDWAYGGEFGIWELETWSSVALTNPAEATCAHLPPPRTPRPAVAGLARLKEECIVLS